MKKIERATRDEQILGECSARMNGKAFCLLMYITIF